MVMNKAEKELQAAIVAKIRAQAKVSAQKKYLESLEKIASSRGV